MKIVVAATQEGWGAKVSTRFGRAEGFSLYDEKKDTLFWYSNAESKQAEHGVGIQAAQLIASLRADVVITGGNFGPKASEVLEKTDVRLVDFVGEITVKEAVEKFSKEAV